MKTTTQEALERINGSIVGDKVYYYDDAMRRTYCGPAADLALLANLMDSKDADMARDAYSHWCSMTSHDECADND